MTYRRQAKEMGRVAHTSMARCTIQEFDDEHDMQQMKKSDAETSCSFSDVERWQQVGMTVHPMPQDQQQGGQGDGAGSGGGGGAGSGGGNGGGGNGGSPWGMDQPKGESAEGVMMFLNGSRSHPVCIGIDDRRSRPHTMKKGEMANYDPAGSGQMFYMRRHEDDKDGIYMLTLDDQQQSGGGSSGGGASARADSSSGGSSGGQSQKRILSIAHVEKQKQQRKSKQQSQGAQGGGGGGASGASAATLADTGASSGSQASQGSDQHLHEGDSVNTEVRLDKTRIQFFKKSQSSGSSGGGASTLADSQTSGGSSSGSSKKRQDGELRGYWDNDQQSWWWKADKQITHDADQQINLKSPKIKHDTTKQTFTGDVHITGNLYVGKEGYKPSNSDWLAGNPQPDMDVEDVAPDEADIARQIEARRRRQLVFQAIIVDDDGNVTVNGDLAISGNLTVRGVITARDFVRSV